MDTVMVFTSKPMDTMFAEGGSGHWSGSRKRLSKCKYIVATKSNTLREHFPSDLSVKQGEAFLIGRVSGVTDAPTGNRSVVQFSEYAKVNFPKAWPGNRNPVAYMNMAELEEKYQFSLDDLEWVPFPIEKVEEVDTVAPLSISDAKLGLAKALGIDPDCIEIRINA